MDYYLDLTDERLRYVSEMLLNRGIVAHDYSKYKNNIKPGDVVIFSPAYKMHAEDAKLLPNGVIILAGKQSDEVMTVLAKCVYLNIMEDDQFVVDNAVLTAENFLPMLITNTKSSIYDEKILILGGGRVAKSLWSLFNKMGVKFTSCMRNSEQMAISKIFTSYTLHLKDLKDKVKDYSVIINTIPAKIFDDSDEFSDNCVIFELSSTSCIENGGINFVPCKALPGKFAPKTAGKLLLEAIDRRLKSL